MYEVLIKMVAEQMIEENSMGLDDQKDKKLVIYQQIRELFTPETIHLLEKCQKLEISTLMKQLNSIISQCENNLMKKFDNWEGEDCAFK